MTIHFRKRIVSKIFRNLISTSHPQKNTIFERNNDRTSVSANSIAMRFLLCIDPNFSWKTLVGPLPQPVTHPSGNHIVNQMVSRYNKRPYNYNDVGEFELIMAPAAPYPFTAAPGEKMLSTSLPRIHSFPDKLSVHFDSLSSAKFFDHLYAKVMKSVSVQMNEFMDTEVTDLKTEVHSLTNQQFILVNISADHTWHRAEKTIQWIEDSLKRNAPTFPVQIMVTRDIVNMSVIGKWEIMFLPSGDRAHNLLSPQEVDRFVSKIVNSPNIDTQ